MCRLLGFEQFMLCDVSAGIHVAGAALKLEHVTIGVEWVGCGH